MKVFYRILISMIMLSLMACSQGEVQPKPGKAVSKAKLRDGNKPKMQFHSEMDTSSSPVSGSPALKALKENHLGVSATRTIGEAFDSYSHAFKKEWRETPTIYGPYYVDYICRFTVGPLSSAALREGVVKRTLEIKFVIQQDGVTYIAMARRIEVSTDGMEHAIIIDPADISRIVTAIYENREITY